MNRMRRRWLRGALAVAALLATMGFAACGDDDGGEQLRHQRRGARQRHRRSARERHRGRQRHRGRAGQRHGRGARERHRGRTGQRHRRRERRGRQADVLVLGRPRRARRQPVARRRRDRLPDGTSQHHDRGRRAGHRHLHRHVPVRRGRQVRPGHRGAVGDGPGADPGLGRRHHPDLRPRARRRDRPLAQHVGEHLRRQALGDAALPDRRPLGLQQGPHGAGRHHRAARDVGRRDRRVHRAAGEGHHALRVRQRLLLDDAAHGAEPRQPAGRRRRVHGQGQLHRPEVRGVRRRLEGDGRRQVLQRRRRVGRHLAGVGTSSPPARWP